MPQWCARAAHLGNIYEWRADFVTKRTFPTFASLIADVQRSSDGSRVAYRPATSTPRQDVASHRSRARRIIRTGSGAGMDPHPRYTIGTADDDDSIKSTSRRSSSIASSGGEDEPPHRGAGG